MLDTEGVLIAVLVVVVLQMLGVDVLGMAGNWFTNQLGNSIIPW